MKKLFLIFALVIAYTLGMTCDECDQQCRDNYRGPALEKCQLKCLDKYCI